jgi:radical SAM superfamily enzyme YgiQ (UPF0313 family)
MKTVLLINPNDIRPPVAPLALEYISSFLAEKRHNIVLYDMNIHKEHLSDVIEKTSPHYVGITVRNIDDSCYATAEFFLDKIRTLVAEVKEKGIPVILGGVGFSIMPLETLAYTGADAGIKGDGEKIFENLISSCIKPKGIIKGSSFHLSNFKPQRRFIDNLFYYRTGGMAGIETTRGCNRKCIYCADPITKGIRVRFRSIASVADEVKQLLQQGIAHYHLCDSEFNLSIEYTKSLCKALIDKSLGKKILWYAYGVPDVMDRELVSLLRNAGCNGINFGVDHTDDRMLAFLGKNHRFEDVKRAVKLCQEEGIKVMIDLLLGAPRETFASIKKVIEDMKALNPYRVGTSYGLRVYPKTAFHEYLKKTGFQVPSSLLRPYFYIEGKIKEGIDEFTQALIQGDERFYFNAKEESNQNYNYNANKVLEDAIKEGFRGAFWDILAMSREKSEIVQIKNNHPS